MSTLKQLQGDVARRMRRGDAFATVEEQVIDPSPLSEEEKAALWLYGWSFVSHLRQRSEAVAHIDRLERGIVRRPSAPILRTARTDLGVARADLEDAVRDHHATMRRSGLRPS